MDQKMRVWLIAEMVTMNPPGGHWVRDFKRTDIGERWHNLAGESISVLRKLPPCQRITTRRQTRQSQSWRGFLSSGLVESAISPFTLGLDIHSSSCEVVGTAGKAQTNVRRRAAMIPRDQADARWSTHQASRTIHNAGREAIENEGVRSFACGRAVSFEPLCVFTHGAFLS
jgi:hypothetical protein